MTFFFVAGRDFEDCNGFLMFSKLCAKISVSAFRTIVSFIKISSGHSLIIKLIFIKVLLDNLRNR
jgi:hypothetical protein